MQARPQELDEFAAYYAKYVQTVSQKEALEKNHSVVLAMYDMLQEYKGKVRKAFIHNPKVIRVKMRCRQLRYCYDENDPLFKQRCPPHLSRYPPQTK